ncbi:MAG: hypothetical protein GY928_32165 [Colwellia sp.]|nr:hypothetical protein [Colwellia sp.]
MENKTHWLKNPNKNYLGHWDLPNNDLTLSIERAGWEDVIDPTKRKSDDGYSQSKRVVHFKENYKPLICNQTNAISIYKSTGIRYLEDSVGARINLYIGEEMDRKNKITVECVRIRHEPVIIKTIQDYPTEKKVLDECKTMDELKNAFLELSQDLQKIFFTYKNELKAKL